MAAHRAALAHLASARHGLPDGGADSAVEHLERRLAAQHERLAHLGRVLGQHVGSRPAAASGGEPAGAPVDAARQSPGRDSPDPDARARAVRQARASADAADAAVAEVERLAERPALLPGLTPVIRNTVVYAACAVVAVAAQYTLIGLGDLGRVDTFAVVAGACAGLPAMAFLTGYVVVAAWGTPRLRAEPVARHPVLGLAVCFLTAPAVYCGYKLITALT